MEDLTAICKLCSLFGPHHNTCSTKTSGTKGEGLYIVIITEEGTSVPRRCETVAATDTEAPRASAWRVLAALCLDPTMAYARKRGLSETQNTVKSGLHASVTSLKRQMNNWVWLCFVLWHKQHEEHVTLEPCSLWAWWRPQWSTPAANTHWSSPQTHLIYNAWCINSDRPCWRTDGGSQRPKSLWIWLWLALAGWGRKNQWPPNGPFEEGSSVLSEIDWIRERQ